MKKKILSVLITILALCMCMFTLTACGETPHTHTYETTIVPPTCTEEGYTAQICHCGDIIGKESIVPATGHDYQEMISNNDGTKTGTCECGDSIVAVDETILIVKNNVVTGLTTYGKTLSSIVIPNSVTSIDDSAFSRCRSLTSIDITNSVTSIGSYAFEYCTSLTSVNYLGTIDSWVQIEFDNSTSNPLYYAKNLYINDELVTQANITTATKINAFAFYYCSSLTSVVIGDSVTSIDYEAFRGCTSLTSIEIPDSVTSIGDKAFYYCSSLTSILVDENNVSYKSIDRNLYSKDGKILIRYSPGKKDTMFTIPNSVTSIGDYAFLGCSSLTSIVIPDSVTSIGEDAFYNCSSLQSITLPFIGETKDGTTNTHFGYIFGAIDDNYNYNYVPTSLKIVVITGGERIDSCAFSNCSSLTSIVIPDSVTSIGNYAFEDCDSLTSIEIPNNVTSIGNYAFSGCSSLTSIDIIPNSVTSIGEGAFSGCSSLTYNIKDGLKYLGNNNNKYLYLADVESDSITSATINNNCRVIGSSAFRYCDSLTSIVIPDSVTSIGEDAFRYCDSLTSVVIGNSVTSIGDYAFGYCSSLTSIKYRGTQSQWKAITKGSSWDYHTGNYTITYNYQGE